MYVLVAYQKTHVDQCGYMIFPWECFMLKMPASVTLFVNAASIPAIVTERAIATCFSTRYEKFGRSIAVILVIAQVRRIFFNYLNTLNLIFLRISKIINDLKTFYSIIFDSSMC